MWTAGEKEALAHLWVGELEAVCSVVTYGRPPAIDQKTAFLATPQHMTWVHTDTVEARSSLFLNIH